MRDSIFYTPQRRNSQEEHIQSNDRKGKIVHNDRTPNRQRIDTFQHTLSYNREHHLSSYNGGHHLSKYDGEHHLSNYDHEQPTDYKQKCLRLIRQLAETEMKNKKQQINYMKLQQECNLIKAQLKLISDQFGMNSIEDMEKMVKEYKESEEWKRLIQGYKSIINTQQVKVIKVEQELKNHQLKIRRLTDIKNKLQEEVKKLSKNNEEMSDAKNYSEKNEKEKDKYQQTIKEQQEEIKLLKDQYRKLSTEKEKINCEKKTILKQKQTIEKEYRLSEKRFQQLQKKYELQIDHFSQIQKTVESKLLEVANEMNNYQTERCEHLSKIDMLQKELSFRENKAYYSFGGVNHESSQTQESGDTEQAQMCLQISVKSLLEENNRLKKVLYQVYTKSTQKELCSEIELQLKILLSMHQNQQNNQLKQQRKQRNIIPIQEEKLPSFGITQITPQQNQIYISEEKYDNSNNKMSEKKIKTQNQSRILKQLSSGSQNSSDSD